MADCQHLSQSIKAKLLEPHQIYWSIGQSAVSAIIIIIVGISSVGGDYLLVLLLLCFLVLF